MDMKWGSWAALMVVATLGACGDSSPPRVDHDSSEEVVGTVQQALGGAGPTLEDLLEDFPELEYREVTFARDNSDYFVLPNPTPFTASAASPTLRRANGFLFNVPSQRAVTLTFNVGNSGLTNNPAIDIAVRNPSGAVVTATPSVVPSDHATGQLPTTVTLGTLPAGNYELDVLPQSAALTYTVSITAGVPLSFRDGADLAQPGTSVYFFVPAEVETAFLLGDFDETTPIQFFPPSTGDFYTPSTTAVTPLTINDRVYAFDTKAKPGVWKATYRTTSSAAHFVNLPDLFSVTPAGVIASKRIRTAMVSTTGGATVSVNSPYYRYNNRFAFYLDEESSPQFFFKAEGENPPGFIVSLLDANGNHLGGTPREINPSVNEPLSAGAPLAPGYYELHVKNQNIYNRYYITVPPNVPFVSVDGYGLGNVFFPSYRGWFTVPAGVTSVRFAAKPGSTPITVYNGTTLVSGQPTSLGNNIFEIATPTPGMWAINMKGEYWSDIRLLNLPQIISFNQNLHMTVAPSGPVHCTTNADCTGGDICGTDNGEQFGLAATDDICWPIECTDTVIHADLCGSVLAPCGLCPDCPGPNCPLIVCDSDSDCSAGRKCGQNNGAYFGLSRDTRV